MRVACFLLKLSLLVQKLNWRCQDPKQLPVSTSSCSEAAGCANIEAFTPVNPYSFEMGKL